ncbi:MAG TPA: DUF2207 domain-containing protein [Vicinamibacterales bacterium]|jgi:hypothetical protein
MPITLSTRRDRAGHICGLLVALLLCATAAGAGPGNYKATRFDVSATAVRGDLEVHESITFEFESGTFTYVWRDIPAARTDGIDVLGVEMDGVRLTEGGPVHFTVDGGNRVRVEWRFPETGPSVHRFDLRYRARGIAYREGASDVLRWRALPAEHRYRIDASHIEFAPQGAQVQPLETRHIATTAVHGTSEAIAIDAAGIDPNGSLVAELRYPAGALDAPDPAWRSRTAAARQLAPRWAMGGASVFVIGLLALLALWRAYPPVEPLPAETTAIEPPEPMPAGLAAVLAANGRVSNSHVIGTLLDLADRGALVIREVRGRLGVRSYELAQVTGSHDLQPHEEEALRIAFADQGEDVTWSRARGRLARGTSRFAAAVNEELQQRGWLDPERKAVRNRLTAVSIVLILLGTVGCIAVAPLVPTHDGWPFLLPAGAIVAAIVGFGLVASRSPLSDQGRIEAARWRGFRRHLKTLAAADADPGGALPSRWIVYATALGLGLSWARYLKRHPGYVPEWFVTTGGDGGHAFAAFVGASGAGGGGAAGAAAAGGGGSGAG